MKLETTIRREIKRLEAKKEQVENRIRTIERTQAALDAVEFEEAAVLDAEVKR